MTDLERVIRDRLVSYCSDIHKGDCYYTRRRPPIKCVVCTAYDDVAHLIGKDVEGMKLPLNPAEEEQ